MPKNFDLLKTRFVEDDSHRFSLFNHYSVSRAIFRRSFKPAFHKFKIFLTHLKFEIAPFSLFLFIILSSLLA